MAEPPSRKNLTSEREALPQIAGKSRDQDPVPGISWVQSLKGNEDLLVVFGFDAQTVVTYGKPQLGFWIFWTVM
jgi:hypothetical protein